MQIGTRKNAVARSVALLIWMVACVLAPGSAAADSRLPQADDPKWREECGSCHLAYAPGLLPSGSWRRLMAGLDRHFGADASLEPAASAAIASFLERNAATGKRAATAGDGLRISEAPWFLRKHRKVDAGTWRSPAVKSPANCAACHAGAARGDFSERGVRIPR